MSKPTDRYRELLNKQKKEFQEKFDLLFLSMEMILDNVDQTVKLNQSKPKKDRVKTDASEI